MSVKRDRDREQHIARLMANLSELADELCKGIPDPVVSIDLKGRKIVFTLPLPPSGADQHAAGDDGQKEEEIDAIAEAAEVEAQAMAEMEAEAEALKRARNRLTSTFIPTPFQQAILLALDGRALRTRQLGAEVGDPSASRLYRQHSLKELVALGLVRLHKVQGYYRPDSPPPGIGVDEDTP